MQNIIRKAQYSFFWKGILSQWAPTPFIVDEILYKTAEHYMMAQKAALFGDCVSFYQIINCPSAAEAQALGRKIKPFDDRVWLDNAQQIVFDGNMAKFQQNPHAALALKSTSGSILVECCPEDTLWGIGMSVDEPGIEEAANWRGRNWLGTILTKVRNQLLTSQNGSEDLLKNKTFLNNICLSYRHDFGLLSPEERDSLLFDAKEWLRAILNNIACV